MKSDRELFQALQNIKLTWIVSHEDPSLFEAIFEGEHVQLRLNDFPDETMFTVFFCAHEIDLEASPSEWHLQHRS